MPTFTTAGTLLSPESITNQFDDEAGGGFIDSITGTEYTQEANERAERRFEDPVGTMQDLLTQGTTGPAPAVTTNEDGDVQVESPEGTEGVNDGIIRILGGDPDTFDEFNQESDESDTSASGIVGKILVVGLVIGGVYLLGNLFTFHVGEGSEA